MRLAGVQACVHAAAGAQPPRPSASHLSSEHLDSHQRLTPARHPHLAEGALPHALQQREVLPPHCSVVRRSAAHEARAGRHQYCASVCSFPAWPGSKLCSVRRHAGCHMPPPPPTICKPLRQLGQVSGCPLQVDRPRRSHSKLGSRAAAPASVVGAPGHGLALVGPLQQDRAGKLLREAAACTVGPDRRGPRQGSAERH